MKSFSEYLNPTPKLDLLELTVSPYYTQKGVANPYYDIDLKDDIVKQTVGDGEIKYKNVESPTGQELLSLGNGKFFFQIEKDGQDTPYYIRTTKSAVKSHFGMKSRKNATASSDVNEMLSVYFFIHPNEMKMDSLEWEMNISKKTGDTGVLLGSGKSLTYEMLVAYLDADETAQRDIKIGQQNAIAIVSDLKGKSVKNVYWTPKQKPANIHSKNPSDVIVELSDGSFIGYSNKIASGVDATPKMNSSVVAQYKKLRDSKQLKTVLKFIDDAFPYAVSTVKDKNLQKTLKVKYESKIKKDPYTEEGSKRMFHEIGLLFKKHNLNFYGQDFYYPYRNFLLDKMMKHLKKPENLLYMLNTMGFYTYPDLTSTPCPYKLLVGSETGSTLKEIGTNEELKSICLNKDKRNLVNIDYKYNKGQQSFTMVFTYKPLKLKCELPITMRTRSAGGWQGRALYMTSSGIKY